MVRMSGEIEAEACLFVREALAFAPFAGHDQRRSGGGAVASLLAEERHLSRGALGFFCVLQRRADRGKQARAPRIDRVECAGANECFDRASIDVALVDAPRKIE